MNNIQFDIDIDFGDRDQILKLIDHVPASIVQNNEIIKHKTGIYVNDIPVNPLNGYSAIEYKSAEELNYIKLDFLNVSIYKAFKDLNHLEEILSIEPPWHRLKEKLFVEQVIHIGNHYNILQKMPEPVDSISTMAMFLAIIRPAKRHLIGRKWKDIEKDVWTKDGEQYGFKSSHSYGYSMMVGLHMTCVDKGIQIEY